MIIKVKNFVDFPISMNEIERQLVREVEKKTIFKGYIFVNDQ